MKRLALSLFSSGLLLSGVAISGCGSEAAPVDPDQVIDRAFGGPAPSAASAGGAGAEVAVTSLGYADAPLRTRKLVVEPAVYAAIREAIAGPAAGREAGANEGGDQGAGAGEQAEGGLRPLIVNLETEGSEELDGVEVDHVAGSIDVARLSGQLSESISAGEADPGRVPGLGDLERLEESLTEATFDLYAATGDGSLERLDLTLSLDDRENALPPTRIRFSLTETEPAKAPS